MKILQTQPSHVSRLVLIASIVAPAALFPANAVELISNGGFESGLTGWTVTDQAGGSGTFYADDADGFTPVSGMATVGPKSGALYGVTDTTGPGAHALTQSFTVVPGSTVKLSYDLFANDWSGTGGFVDPAGLDFTVSPNQHARVDIITGAAGGLDGGAAILANYYLGNDGLTPPFPYTHYDFDVTGIVGGGGTFQIRFGEVDNQFFFNLGIDNVSIDTSIPGTPDSGSTLSLLGLALAGLAVQRRTSRQ